jgi:ABC-type dipeptide/oligopeptide/nickel transport system permease subunit
VTTKTSTTHKTIAKLDQHEETLVSESYFQKAYRRLRSDRLTMIAIIILTTLSLLSLFAPFISEYILQVDPNDTQSAPAFLSIGAPGHLLGTDDLGRDQLARLLHAGRISLGIGFAGSILTLGIGLVFGMTMGYYGGIIDDVMNWVITTLDSIPSLYLLIIISAVLSPSAETLIIVLALVGWTGTTRLIRGQTIQIRNLEYVHAARAMGASPWRIMFSHILPNLISVTAISLALGVGGLILSESALSFLSIGVQPPTATWGNMLSKSQQFFRLGAHLVFLPGLMIFLVVLSSFIIGDGIRDAFDPTTGD